MTALDNLYQLVEKYERDQRQFQQPDYNEAQLRQEFVNPFFAALGWDVGDSKQVLHEAGLRSGGSVKHPDYSFLAGARRAFYVETKKPAINIGNSVDPAEQLRSYGWSGNIALGILTNFAEFAVYDCRIEPKQGDSPAEARIMYLTHSQYLDQWERLQETLSPEAVRQGRHSDLLEATAKGVLRVDEAFLRDMETWRVDLAEHLHKQARFIDRTLNQRELNHLVQRTIDRIVFLRIAEDRNLESYGRLERAALSKGVYAQIKKLYLAADRRYNSGLFHFNPADKSRPDADTLSLDIYIVDNVLRRIINDLYPPKSRYQFSVISADILGQVYERFLGKVIEVRSDDIKTAVTVEEKPEVRKAGGVYYTPSYIVDYIVENTVGALLHDKTPAEVVQLRVLDPACGSGSFLTGAYQYLLDWHLAEYRENPQRYKNRIRHSTDGIILRIEEKRRILLDNIYGVDLDQNAVEVSKLSLLLKMLENEHDTLDIEEPLLPDLSGNIKWGNSLIGSDFFSGDELAEKDDEELLCVKPFDWDSASGFGAIMAAGGFDAVIGNPPYDVLEKDRKKSTSPHIALREYIKSTNKFDNALGGKLNLFRFFVVHSIGKLLKTHGRFGMIVPLSLWADKSCAKSRRFVIASSKELIADCFPQKDTRARRVFRDAKLSTTVVTCTKIPVEESNSELMIRVYPWNKFEDNHKSAIVDLTDMMLIDPKNLPVPLVNQKDWRLCSRIYHVSGARRLGDVDDFRVNRGEINQTVYRDYISEDDSKVRLLKGVEVGRYRINQKLSQGHREWFDEELYLSDKTAKDVVYKERIATQRITGIDERLRIVATIVKPKVYFADSTNSIYMASDHSHYSLRYLLGILNSFLFQWRFKLTSSNNNVATNELDAMPFRTIDFDNPADVAMHDKLVGLVERMLDLHRQADLTVVQRSVVKQRIEATDREIDKLVYELYGLSEDEVAVVEGG